MDDDDAFAGGDDNNDNDGDNEGDMANCTLLAQQLQSSTLM